ncbi:MAG: response regulator [Myxococcota bacterium]|nr:response regulator [Myxococcota bacterium]
MARLLIVEDTPELAALIASVARSRGHSTEHCQSGAAALEAVARQPPDLAIVDLLLPDVGGKEVLRELKERGIRAIAISGVFKGASFHQELTGELGALAFFEKPFDLKSLLDAVDRVVGNPVPGPAEMDEDALEELEVLSPLEEDAEEPVLVLDEEAPGPDAAPDSLDPRVLASLPEGDEDLTDVPTAVTQVDPALLAATSSRQAPASGPPPRVSVSETTPPPGVLETAPPPVDVPETVPPAAAPLPLPFAERERVWSKPAAPEKKSRRELPEWSQAGDLATTSVPRLLTAYYQASHGGVLKLRQGNVNKVVYFEEGHPVYAASNVAAERFVRFCVRKGVVSEGQVAMVAQRVKEQEIRSGEALLQLGILTPERRQSLLEDQVREIIWSTFGWTTGQYAFSPRRPAQADLVRLRVHPGNLILQGVQRTETLVSLRRKLPPTRRLRPSPDPAYALHELQLSGPQALLLAYADGSKTVEDLLTLIDLPEKDALATLLGLELMGVLVERTDESKRRRISYGL